MQQGFYAKLVFSNSGNLVAISTGADATTEHETGIAPLLRDLTESAVDEAALVKKLKGPLRRFVKYPNLAESRRIARLPEGYQFIETVTEGQPEAWLGYANRPLTDYARQLPIQERLSSFADSNVAGAWDSTSFGIRVRGKKYVKALRQFDQAIRAGDALFAGTFFKRPTEMLSGIILANRKFLSTEDKAAMAAAQVEWESKMRLKARDDSIELTRLIHEMSGRRDLGYLWVKWADAQESAIVYGLNPDNGTPADYLGPYTRQQLLDWARSKYAYRLTPLQAAA